MKANTQNLIQWVRMGLCLVVLAIFGTNALAPALWIIDACNSWLMTFSNSLKQQ